MTTTPSRLAGATGHQGRPSGPERAHEPPAPRRPGTVQGAQRRGTGHRWAQTMAAATKTSMELPREYRLNIRVVYLTDRIADGSYPIPDFDKEPSFTSFSCDLKA